VTLDALLHTTGRLAAEGEIAGPVPARYLLACLKTALAHTKLGQRASADRQLTCFLKGLDAYAARGVSPAADLALRPAVLALLGFVEAPLRVREPTSELR
jgi:hypothetical protein